MIDKTILKQDFQSLFIQSNNNCGYCFANASNAALLNQRALLFQTKLSGPKTNTNLNNFHNGRDVLNWSIRLFLAGWVVKNFRVCCEMHFSKIEVEFDSELDHWG